MAADRYVDEIKLSELTNAERIDLVQARATMALATAMKIIAEPELSRSNRPKGDGGGEQAPDSPARKA